MKTNIATTQEQSQRLLRCGVSDYTADMCYDSGALSLMDYDNAIHERDSRRESYEVIPAWSLSVLLSDILPSDISDNEIDYSLFLQRRRSEDNTPTWELSYYNLEYDATLLFVETDCPIEAATHMVEILINRGYKLNDCPRREKGEENE